MAVVDGADRPVRSLAVLPFDAGGSDEAGTVMQGLAASLSDELARHPELEVIAGARTAAYAGSRNDAAPIAQELGADAVLRTTVTESGDRIQLEATLMRADGRRIWSESYQRQRSELFALERALATDVAKALGVGSSTAARAAVDPPTTTNPKAYDLYLRGRYYTGRWNLRDLDAAIALLEQAVAIDPTFGAAQAHLGMLYSTKAFNFRPNEPLLREKAYSAVTKALALDPQSGEAHHARGILIWQPSEGFPHRGALAEFRQALASRPNLDESWHHRGVVLMHIGHLDRAKDFYERAVALNPANTQARFRLAPVLNYQLKFEEAITVLRRIPRDVYPSQWSYHMAWSLVSLGRTREAAQEIEVALAASPTDQGGVIHATRALLRSKTGDRRGAEADIAAALEAGKGFGHFHHTALTLGEVYAVLGELDRAQDWVEKAANDGFPCYAFFEVDPHLEPLRATERFRRFIAQLRAEWQHIDGEEDDQR